MSAIRVWLQGKVHREHYVLITWARLYHEALPIHRRNPAVHAALTAMGVDEGVRRDWREEFVDLQFVVAAHGILLSPSSSLAGRSAQMKQAAIDYMNMYMVSPGWASMRGPRVAVFTLRGMTYLFACMPGEVDPVGGAFGVLLPVCA